METSTNEKDLPRYKCHKEVGALKIAEIDYDLYHAAKEGRPTDGSAMIIPADNGHSPFRVDREYIHKHKPMSGGYYVVYEDGYVSYSSAKAFESGYSKVKENL